MAQLSQSETRSLPPRTARTFTLDRANAALPYVRRVVEDIQAIYEQVVQHRRCMESGEDGEAERDYHRALDRLGELVDEVQFVGVELKDFERGLVDFPAEMDGRPIMLCWHAGEPTVSHWHEVDQGYASRHPALPSQMNS